MRHGLCEAQHKGVFERGAGEVGLLQWCNVLMFWVLNVLLFLKWSVRLFGKWGKRGFWGCRPKSAMFVMFVGCSGASC